MILEADFEELNSEFKADFGEVHIITDADFIATNVKLDERIHGEDTGAVLDENVDKVIAILDDVETAIKEKGIAVTEAEEYADVIRSEMTTGSGINPEWTHWNNYFAYNQRLDILGKLKYSDTSNAVAITYMFYMSTDVLEVPSFDKSNVNNANYAFGGMKNVKIIRSCKLSKATNVSYLCHSCNNLETIYDLDISSATNASMMFYKCDALKNVNFVGIIPISISFQYSPLSMESIKSAVTHLKDYSGTDKEFTETVTFKTGLWDEFNATECTEEGYATWAEYVAAKGWNVK